MCLFCFIGLKIQAKKAEMQKKRVRIQNLWKKEKKCIFNFEIHTNKSKNEKKKAHFFGFSFAFISRPVIHRYIFCILKFIKKDKKKKKKKETKFFQIAKIDMPFFTLFFYFLSIFQRKFITFFAIFFFFSKIHLQRVMVFMF